MIFTPDAGPQIEAMSHETAQDNLNFEQLKQKYQEAQEMPKNTMSEIRERSDKSFEINNQMVELYNNQETEKNTRKEIISLLNYGKKEYVDQLALIGNYAMVHQLIMRLPKEDFKKEQLQKICEAINKYIYNNGQAIFLGHLHDSKEVDVFNNVDSISDWSDVIKKIVKVNQAGLLRDVVSYFNPEENEQSKQESAEDWADRLSWVNTNFAQSLINAVRAHHNTSEYNKWADVLKSIAEEKGKEGYGLTTLPSEKIQKELIRFANNAAENFTPEELKDKYLELIKK